MAKTRSDATWLIENGQGPPSLYGGCIEAMKHGCLAINRHSSGIEISLSRQLIGWRNGKHVLIDVEPRSCGTRSVSLAVPLR
jgi:hypothetical protein